MSRAVTLRDQIIAAFSRGMHMPNKADYPAIAPPRLRKKVEYLRRLGLNIGPTKVTRLPKGYFLSQTVSIIIPIMY